ncbi:hypothetical protein BH11ACT8_BH11ACT8_13380 [soil metagenome]
MTSAFWLSKARTVGTLLALALVVVLAVRWGFNAVTQPFPQKAETPVCVESEVAVKDVLRPGAITISVLNAGGTEGLASRTLNDLVDQGFAEGDLANAPKDAKVGSVAIWTDDRKSPAVKLLRSYLGGKKVQIIKGDGTALGLNVIVGDQFAGVSKGRAKIVATSPTTVCTPPALS